MNNTLKDFFEKISEVKQRTNEEIIQINGAQFDKNKMSKMRSKFF